MPRALKDQLRCTLAGLSYASRLYRVAHRGRVLILSYHRVIPYEESTRRPIQPGMYVTSEAFLRQIEFLQTHYEVVSLAEVLDSWERGTLSKSRRYCVITFDDGWVDTYAHAFQILKRYNTPATVFLPTAYIGTREWFWTDKVGYLLGKPWTGNLQEGKRLATLSLLERYGAINGGPFRRRDPLNNHAFLHLLDRAIESLKRYPSWRVEDLINSLSSLLACPLPAERVFLNWEEIEEMSRYDITFGSHSSTHRILTLLPPDQVREELAESLRVLKNRSCNLLPVLCYPNGDYNSDVQQMAKACGYKAALSVHPGLETNTPSDQFAIRRLNVHQDISGTIPLFSLHTLAIPWLLTNRG